jgi:alanyl-tRNA synthetase
MDSHTIRRLFLDFFVAKGHREVPSSSLVPGDDPTLLFTNAGMVQFKRVFLGQEQRDYLRATTCQKCVRAGGKHNDLEQVGHTKRHHTFFEMLGNFSFGDYFKRDAIAYAWEFVTSPAYLGIAPERLRVTVHHSDDEARSLWRDISGLPDHRIYGLGDKDNFWQMGDTGPCGPCTEIYVDLADRRSAGHADYLIRERVQSTAHSPDGLSTDVIPKEEFERLAEEGHFLEIWNLVFMQYDRAVDGTLTPLPKPSVDTGAGLERIAAVMQCEDDNFHTDLFSHLLDKIGQLIGQPYDELDEDPNSFILGPRISYRVLADHARAVSFLIADGVTPSNEARGYVLRRILRRAVRHAWLLGRREPTLVLLTQVVVQQLGDVYPELFASQEQIRAITEAEERRFLQTIEGGLKRLDEIFASGVETISGAEAFKLYDTFGFPIDLTQIIAVERGLSVDLAGFERALEEQRKRSREARDVTGAFIRSGAKLYPPSVHLSKPGKWQIVKRGKQKFIGYTTTTAETDVLAFRQEGPRVEVVLRENPFYAESGGQVSDTGKVLANNVITDVESVRKTERGTALGLTYGEDFEPSTVEAIVDKARRQDIERNHSATHLVHYVLRKRLGTHVRQQGSLVEPQRLRFDFSHHGPIDAGTLEAIEAEVNDLLLANYPVETRQMPYADALALGAMAFFSEKYGDRVRVVQMGPSIELCGGTHVRTTGQIGTFRLSGQSGVAAGVRRIEAVTGTGALREVRELERRLAQLAETLKAQPEHLVRRVEQLLEERQRLEARLAETLRAGGGGSPRGNVSKVADIELTVAETASEDRAELGRMADTFREGRRNGILVLFSAAGRGSIHVTLTDDLVQAGRRAGDLVNRIAALSGGRGGGRPHFASAGAGDPARLAEARAATPELVASWLADGQVAEPRGA